MTAHIDRYSRQKSLPQIGESGQQKLKNSAVLVIGAGGLGSPLMYYLAAAGVGHITVADFDVVDMSNLNRQILHGNEDIGVAKVDSAAATLGQFNPEVSVHTVSEKITTENIVSLVHEADLVLDAVDSFGAKFIINDACVAAQKPFVHAGVTGFKGQLYLYTPGSACLRCMFPALPKELEAPQGLSILGATAGCIGTMQALEAIKFLVGIPAATANRIISFDGLAMRQSSIGISRSDACPVCR